MENVSAGCVKVPVDKRILGPANTNISGLNESDQKKRKQRYISTSFRHYNSYYLNNFVINTMNTLQDLIRQRDALNVQIEEMQKALRAEALSEIRARMREHQISVEDLDSPVKSGREKPKTAPKYRNPETGKTWSGRGKRPQWIHDALADGQSLDKYLI